MLRFQFYNQLTEEVGQGMAKPLIRLEAEHAVRGEARNVAVQRPFRRGRRCRPGRHGVAEEHHGADEFVHPLNGVGKTQFELLPVVRVRTRLAGHGHHLFIQRWVRGAAETRGVAQAPHSGRYDTRWSGNLQLNPHNKEAAEVNLPR